MGGGYYGTAPDQINVMPETRAESAMSVFENKSMNSALDPINNQSIQCDSKSAVIVAIDVTGSMGSWTTVLWKKMPMFFGQMCMKGYLESPSVCFAAVGDAYTDRAPLQVAPFASGAALDGYLQKIWLEGRGGGQGKETYELAGYYFSRYSNVTACTTKPFLFITGDEMFYDNVEHNQVRRFLGKTIPKDIPAQDIWNECLAKYHLFLVHKPNDNEEKERKCMQQWKAAIGAERVLYFEDPNAIVDVMLGAIALSSGARTLGSYVNDLRERGQTEDRCKIVGTTLSPLQKVLLEAKSKSSSSSSDTKSAITSPAVAATGGTSSSSGTSEKKKKDHELDQLQADLIKLRISAKNFPEKFVCPLSQEVFKDPVMADDNETYERTVIEEWFKTEGAKSPLTNAPLDSTDVMPNTILVGKMKAWRDSNKPGVSSPAVATDVPAKR